MSAAALVRLGDVVQDSSGARPYLGPWPTARIVCDENVRLPGARCGLGRPMIVADPAPSTGRGLPPTTRTRRRRPHRRAHRRRLRLVLLVVGLALVPVGVSYVRAMMRPSSVSLGVRSVEWQFLCHVQC